MGQDLQKRLVYPTTEHLADGCIAMLASVGWIRYFSGQDGKPQYHK